MWRWPGSVVSTTEVKHSRLKSSITVKMRCRFPSESVFNTKSGDQLWFASCEVTIGALVPNARFRPPRLRMVRASSSSAPNPRALAGCACVDSPTFGASCISLAAEPAAPIPRLLRFAQKHTRFDPGQGTNPTLGIALPFHGSVHC